MEARPLGAGENKEGELDHEMAARHLSLATHALAARNVSLATHAPEKPLPANGRDEIREPATKAGTPCRSRGNGEDPPLEMPLHQMAKECTAWLRPQNMQKQHGEEDEQAVTFVAP